MTVTHSDQQGAKFAPAQTPGPPDQLVPEQWRTRPDFVSKDRYISPDFARLERERLWTRTWQPVCRVEELQSPGAFLEYEVGDQSVLIVRVDHHTIKAYANACRHRGTRLAQGCGTFDSAGIRCQFHGWRWDIRGANTFVLHPEEFSAETTSAENLRLREFQVGEWAGWVFVNPDRTAPPLAEALAPIAALLDPMRIDLMRVLWYKTTTLPANWKTALDAFTEAYHIPATHPELLALGSAEERLVYSTLGNGHSRYGGARKTGEIGRSATPSPVLGLDPDDYDERQILADGIANSAEQLGGIYTDQEKYLAAQLRRREIPEGSSASREFVKMIYEYSVASGIPLPRVTPEQAAEYGGVFYIFPNLMILPMFGSALMYRVRPVPGDPDSCYWDVIACKLFPEDVRPPELVKRHVHHLDREAVGLIPYQDFSNMEAVTKGMHSDGFEGLSLNLRQEQGILNMHNEIDNYLFRAKS